MSEIREGSRITTASPAEKPRYASVRGGEVPPPGGNQSKKAKRKKREKNSWKNGGFGAVNPKLARGFLKTTQVSTVSGKRMKIQEIPLFRDAAQRLPAVHRKSLKAAPLPTAKNPLLTPCTVEPTSYETDCGKPVILAPVKAKKASSVQGLPIPRLEPESAVAHRGVPQLPPTCSPVIKPVVSSPADAHPVSPPKPKPLEHPAIPPLITAVLQCDYRALERLLKDPTVNVNAQDMDGRTALHHAVRQKDLEATKRLLSHPNMDPNVRDILKGNTGLIDAVINNDVELVQLFLDHPKTDPNLPNDLGNIPLIEALQINNERIVKQFIDHAKIDLTVLDCFNSSTDEIKQLFLLKQMISGYPSEGRESVIHKSLNLFYSFAENAMIIR